MNKLQIVHWFDHAEVQWKQMLTDDLTVMLRFLKDDPDASNITNISLSTLVAMHFTAVEEVGVPERDESRK